MPVRPKHTVAVTQALEMHMAAVVVMPVVAFVSMRFSNICTHEN